MNRRPLPGFFPLKICVLLIVLIASAALHAQRYELVWSDEFNEEELDINTWTAWTGTAYNNEDQYYTPRDTNLYVKNGELHIVGLRENYGGRNWTSGRIKSQYNADFLYGVVEIRAKLPEGMGLWPAFWMMPTNSEYGSWPYSGEMDIMEYRGHQTNRTQGTIHFSSRKYPGSGSANADRRYISEEYILPEGSLASDYHIYKFEWTDSTMSWYLNDVHFHTIKKAEVLERSEYYPFDKEFYIILNLAIGGNYLGNNQPDETTPDRNEVLVDYVRVYQDVNISPVITLDYQSIEKITVNAEYNLTASVTDPDTAGAVEKVEFYLNHQLYTTLTEAPYTTSWTPSIDGCYPFQVKAYDNDNGVSVTENEVIFEVGTGCERTPYQDTLSFPGTIELELFDLGGNENSYFDKSPDENTGNVFRTTEAVDISEDPNQAGNFLISDTENGEWMRYTLKVTESGIYNFELRAVPDGGTGRVDLKLDGEDWIYFTRLFSGEEPYIYKSRNEIPLDKGTYDLEVYINQAGIKPDRITGTLISSTSREQDGTTPSGVTLFQNYPNPFNPSTSISFELPASNTIALKVYNSLGKHVKTLFEGKLAAGTHDFTFDASGLSSGLYHYQLIVEGESVETRKMLLLK